MKSFYFCAIISAYLVTSESSIGQVLQQPQRNFGPGRISSNQAKNFRDQSVTACGLGSYPVPQLPGIDIGEPGLGGTVGAD
jgi:hypothetical protein